MTRSHLPSHLFSSQDSRIPIVTIASSIEQRDLPPHGVSEFSFAVFLASYLKLTDSETEFLLPINHELPSTLPSSSPTDDNLLMTGRRSKSSLLQFSARFVELRSLRHLRMNLLSLASPRLRTSAQIPLFGDKTSLRAEFGEGFDHLKSKQTNKSQYNFKNTLTIVRNTAHSL